MEEGLELLPAVQQALVSLVAYAEDAGTAALSKAREDLGSIVSSDEDDPRLQSAVDAAVPELMSCLSELLLQ